MIKRIALCLFVVMLLIFPQIIHAQNRQQGVNDKELLNYGIQFTPPIGWEKIRSESVKSAILFLSPDKNASILISYPRRVSKQSFQVSLSLLRTNILKTSIKPYNEEKTTISGEEAYVFTIMQTNSKGMKVKTKDYQFYKNGNVYTIDLNAAEIDFERYLPELEEALTTFKVL